MQIWHRLRRMDVSVPGDVKLAGFDGDEYGELVVESIPITLRYGMTS
jgi:hypothetical protein